MFFNGPPTGSANAALSADEAVIQLPQVLCLDNLIVLLVLTGRIPAAAELNWRALRRPVALYTVRSGVACLIAMLRESVAMGHVSSVEALQVLEEIEGV